MARIDKVIYSDTNESFEQISLSCGFYETTYILLKDEKIEVDVHCKGNITLYNEKQKVILKTQAPKSIGGREIYMDLSLKVENHQLIMLFPIYTWIDHYPHCDGESDRWATKPIGYHNVTIDLDTLQVTIIEDEDLCC